MLDLVGDHCEMVQQLIKLTSEENLYFNHTVDRCGTAPSAVFVDMPKLILSHC